MNPLRRMRVRLFSCHNPPVWAAYFEPPGRSSCYCHAPTLDAMWKELAVYYAGKGYCPPQRVEDRLMQFFRPSDEARVRKAALADATSNGSAPAGEER